MAVATDPDRELEQLRADCRHLTEQQQQIMELLGSQSPERIVHDLRNLHNELVLLRAVADRET